MSASITNTVPTTSANGLQCCPQLNKNCCKVTISVTENAEHNAVVKIVNGGCYKLQPFLRFRIGPVVLSSVVILDNEDNSASLLQCAQTINDGEYAEIRYNKCLPAGHEVTFIISGSFGSPVTACITCFEPIVTSKCQALAVQERNKLRSMARGVNCCLDICSEPICWCNYFMVTGASGAAAVLYRLNTTTSKATKIGDIKDGATQLTHMTGLAVDPLTGTLYGVTSQSSHNVSGNLYKIDTLTGQATLVGATKFSTVPSIAFNSGGELFGWAKYDASNVLVNDLVKFDLKTGTATIVGDSALNTETVAISFNSLDQLYLKYYETGTKLVRVDEKTGKPLATTEILLHPLNPAPRNCLVFVCGNDKAPFSLTINNDGPAKLQTIDIESGTISTFTTTIKDATGNTEINNISTFTC